MTASCGNRQQQGAQHQVEGADTRRFGELVPTARTPHGQCEFARYSEYAMPINATATTGINGEWDGIANEKEDNKLQGRFLEEGSPGHIRKRTTSPRLLYTKRQVLLLSALVSSTLRLMND
ncbi:hypothetical protein CVT26_004445 [Gymnopilus dilepis]|uniref:Uncharacterized protein n=1 Tax=Gymnopilus dilepis TaxID=231916 RepID=A0A409W6X5_9AGAR|nr:hypothetical protein CVT26_004445 [Gymnopilus dilepis]